MIRPWFVVPARAAALSAIFAVAVAVAVAGPASVAGASAHRPGNVRNGYYATISSLNLPDGEFHVRSKGVRIPDLALSCLPAAPFASFQTGYTNIYIHAPVLRISHGSLSYNGSAKVTAAYVGAPTLGTSTLRISATHVNGPVYHYTYQGHHLAGTTAFLGSVSSPACASVPHGGRFKLFGPVAGE